MIETLPKDHAPLSSDETAVLETIYEEFAKTSELVDVKTLMFQLKGGLSG